MSLCIKKIAYIKGFYTGMIWHWLGLSKREELVRWNLVSRAPTSILLPASLTQSPSLIDDQWINGDKWWLQHKNNCNHCDLCFPSSFQMRLTLLCHWNNKQLLLEGVWQRSVVSSCNSQCQFTQNLTLILSLGFYQITHKNLYILVLQP